MLLKNCRQKVVDWSDTIKHSFSSRDQHNKVQDIFLRKIVLAYKRKMWSGMRKHINVKKEVKASRLDSFSHMIVFYSIHIDYQDIIWDNFEFHFQRTSMVDQDILKHTS